MGRELLIPDVDHGLDTDNGIESQFEFLYLYVNDLASY